MTFSSGRLRFRSEAAGVDERCTGAVVETGLLTFVLRVVAVEVSLLNVLKDAAKLMTEI